MRQSQFLPAQISKCAGVAAKADQKQVVVPDRNTRDGRHIVGRLIVCFRQNAPIAAFVPVRKLHGDGVAPRINAARVDDKALLTAPVHGNGPGEERRCQRRVGTRPAGIAATRIAFRQYLRLTGQRFQARVMHRHRDRTPGSGPVMPGEAKHGGQRQAVRAGRARPDPGQPDTRRPIARKCGQARRAGS